MQQVEAILQKILIPKIQQMDQAIEQQLEPLKQAAAAVPQIGQAVQELAQKEGQAEQAIKQLADMIAKIQQMATAQPPQVTQPPVG